MDKIDLLVDLLERKGWHIYRAANEQDPLKLLSSPRVKRPDPGTPYYLIPATSDISTPKDKFNVLMHAGVANRLPHFEHDSKAGIVKVFGYRDDTITFMLDSGSVELPIDSEDDLRLIIQNYISNYYDVKFFDSAAQLEQFAAGRKMTPQAESPLERQTRWLYVTDDSESGRIGIYPENPGHFLFRGQSQRYSPCWSTASRSIGSSTRQMQSLSDAEKATIIVNLTRTDWFVRELRETVPCKELRGQLVQINEVALAQHYGLPTGYIDLTQSLQVAMFFACAKFDGEVQNPTPVTEGEGVIYVLDFKKQGDFSKLKPIGLQAYGRPAEQWGWTYEMTLGDDFELLPTIERWYFKHDLQESIRVLNCFAGQKTLFPNDPLVKLAEAIKLARKLPREHVERRAEDLISNPDGLLGMSVEKVVNLCVSYGGVEFENGEPVPNIDEIRGEIEADWIRKREGFFKGVTVRLVRSSPDDDASDAKT